MIWSDENGIEVAVTEEEDEAVPEDDKSADVKVTAKEENLSPDDTEKSKK